MTSRIEAATFEPEPKFVNIIIEIKYDHFDVITSIATNLSAITPNKISLSSEHIKGQSHAIDTTIITRKIITIQQALVFNEP